MRKQRQLWHHTWALYLNICMSTEHSSQMPLLRMKWSRSFDWMLRLYYNAISQFCPVSVHHCSYLCTTGYFKERHVQVLCHAFKMMAAIGAANETNKLNQKWCVCDVCAELKCSCPNMCHPHICLYTHPLMRFVAHLIVPAHTLCTCILAWPFCCPPTPSTPFESPPLRFHSKKITVCHPPRRASSQHAHIHTCTHTHTRTHTPPHKSQHRFTYTYEHIHALTHPGTFTFTHTHMHTFTHSMIATQTLAHLRTCSRIHEHRPTHTYALHSHRLYTNILTYISIYV